MNPFSATGPIGKQSFSTIISILISLFQQKIRHNLLADLTVEDGESYLVADSLDANGFSITINGDGRIMVC